MEKAYRKGIEQREKLNKYLTCQKITKEIISGGGGGGG